MGLSVINNETILHHKPVRPALIKKTVAWKLVVKRKKKTLSTPLSNRQV
jgi:hypothetical protein